MSNKKTSFEIYRYQIIPQNRYWEPELFADNKYKTIDELIANKNTIFANILNSLPINKFPQENRIDLNCKILSQEQDEYLFELAVGRKILIEKQDFEKETLTNWPSFKFFVWNSPRYQYAVIQKRIEAVANTKTIIYALSNTINQQLKKYNLRVYFEALFEQRRFWDTVSNYRNGLKEVRFELITPNMANISECLTDELKELAKETNSCKMTVSLLSDNESALKIDNSNECISGMLNYASEGGGNITFRAKKIRRLIKTNNSIKRIELDDVVVNGSNPHQVIKSIKESLQ